MLTIIRCRNYCLAGCYPKNLKIKIYRTIILPVVLYGCETWSQTHPNSEFELPTKEGTHHPHTIEGL